MQEFFSDPNIDYLSPQLYADATETSNDYSTEKGVSWEQYTQSSAKFLPNIVHGSYYPDAQSYFKNYGITSVGYIQWNQTVTTDESEKRYSTSNEELDETMTVIYKKYHL